MTLYFGESTKPVLFVLPEANFDVTRDSDVKHASLARHDVDVVGLLHAGILAELRSIVCVGDRLAPDFFCGFPDFENPLPGVIPKSDSEGGRRRDLAGREAPPAGRGHPPLPELW